MSRFMRGLFQTARTISTIDPTAPTTPLGDPSPAPVGTFVRWYKCSFVQLYVCASLCRIPYYLYLSHSNIFVRILVSCLTLFFLVLLRLFFCFIYPLPMFRHADRPALFQRFNVVCFLDLLTPLLVCIVIANNRLGSQPSEVGTVSTPRHLHRL